MPPFEILLPFIVATVGFAFVPGAASLITKATFNRMYKISGQTALSLGIATSLSAR